MKNQIIYDRQQKTEIRNRHLTISFVMGVFVYYLSSIIYHLPVNAQETVDTPLDLNPIIIPIFSAPFNLLPDSEYATALSWLGFAGSIATVGIVAFWIYLILKASFQALKSQENPDEIGAAAQKVKSTFIGAGLSIIIPVLISIVGVFVGAGPLWSWPAAFRRCDDGTNRYYFQVVVEFSGQPGVDAKSAIQQADARCFR